MTAQRSDANPDGGRAYQLGFANEFATEALVGALPIGQNSPQKLPYGLVSELVSGTAFTAPRALNRRSYLFRIRPSTIAEPFAPYTHSTFLTPPLPIDPYPGALRWGPSPLPSTPVDFLDGLSTICGNGSPKTQSGTAIHIYNASVSMTRRVFANADGEMLIIPQEGALRVVTESGVLDVAPGELVLIPKGMKIRVELVGTGARGFLCENYGLPFVLPELGLIGSHGLANAIDFQAPVAAFEDDENPVELVHKLAGNFWTTLLDHSPFDVVAWRGNWAPVKYDMRRFAVMGAAGVDHPDPSIYCALTSPSSDIAGGNADFMILPPRWIVAEHTFRPPGYHRNSVAEFLALIEGSNESRASAFPPGSMSLHNHWTAHGPDVRTFEAAREGPLDPTKIRDTLIFMIESRYPLELSPAAMNADFRMPDSAAAWSGFQRRFPVAETSSRA
ncbi:homogentisate 1,2-dioxygenase [soil metagenome]